MSPYPEQRLLIQLNTLFRNLESTPACDIRAAKNDDHWCLDMAARVINGTTISASAACQEKSLRAPAISRRQCNRVSDSRAKSIYRFVKLGAVADQLDRYQGSVPSTRSDTCILDINCRNGIDEAVRDPVEVVLALDVVPELFSRPDTLNTRLRKLSEVAAGSSLILIATRHACLDAAQQHFIIEATVGIGFLSALSGSLTKSRLYNRTSLPGKMYRYVCDQLFRHRSIKAVDLFLTRTFGKVPIFKDLCSGILIVASPRHARPERVRCQARW